MMKTYHAKQAKGLMAIDANWDKAAWKDIEPLTLGFHMGDKPEHWPKVQAKVRYDADNIYVIWRVDDNYVVARQTRHQHYVCVDSCVEFFFTPSGDPKDAGYLNLEMNCAGVMWLACHAPGRADVMLPPEDLAKLEVATSLKGPILEEIARPTMWTVEYRLPVSILEKYSKVARPRPGVSWRANFYKCADDSSHPHWLTWSEVIWPRPSFHLPQYFGTLQFE